MLGVRSRGSVTLYSADPLAQPAIDPAYLADGAAVREWIRANVATASMRRAVARWAGTATRSSIPT